MHTNYLNIITKNKPMYEIKRCFSNMVLKAQSLDWQHQHHLLTS